MSNASPELRRQIRANAVGLLPPQHVDEVVDLAIHAFDQAFSSMSAIVTRASSPGLAVAATGIALSLIAQEAQAKLEGLETFTKANGGVVHIRKAGGARG
jgi:hypothetical protein